MARSNLSHTNSTTSFLLQLIKKCHVIPRLHGQLRSFLPFTHFKFKPLIVAIFVSVLAIGSTLSAPSSTQAATADTILPVPYISQYQRQYTQNFDCGPASVAMVLRYFWGDAPPPGYPSDAAIITDMRYRATGANTQSDTTFTQLETALSSYGFYYTEIPNTLSPAPNAQIQEMQWAINNGDLVIALINGTDLGRGWKYGGHWVVVIGFSSDGQMVYLNDPDNQAPRWSGWISGGGSIPVSLSTFKQAALDAPLGPYGIVVYQTFTV